MSAQYIFTTHKLSRRYPPDKEVLTDISLSFYPGAKIGVLGYNGAGKSSLLRIMAGIDNEFDGQAVLGTNVTVGMLSQEPGLNEAKDVKGTVEDGVSEIRALLDRFNELSMKRSSSARISETPSSTVPFTSLASLSPGSWESIPTVTFVPSTAWPSNSLSIPAMILSSDDLPAPL